ncbi:uncharacterized protein LOC126630609 [Malus sylvestris]|uniref:uncharacterized protein LOC126630609 n=1 Tax=Malus sylvestris TaxID=3752 RepID=UPI0021AD2184|nr:uncharacterized protein LOC126630609 [Malus sylvestris]
MFIVQSTEDPAYRAISMLLSELKDEVHAKIVVAGISTTCSQKIHNQLAQPILPELLENSTTKVIEYGRKHVEGRDGDSTDVGKSGDPFSRLLGPKEEEGVNNMKLALAKDILDDDDNGVQDYDSPRTTRTDMLSLPTRG